MIDIGVECSGGYKLSRRLVIDRACTSVIIYAHGFL